MKPKYNLKTFPALLKRRAKGVKFKLWPSGAIRATKTVNMKTPCQCPLAVAFPRLHWNDEALRKFLSFDSQRKIMDAADYKPVHSKRLRHQLLKAVGLVALLLMFMTPARAWNCSNPLSERVLVPPGTTGTFGDGDGQLAQYQGALYICKTVPSTPSTTPTTSTSGSSSNSTSTSSSNSQATSISNSGSNSASKSSATGGNSSASGGSLTNSGNSQASSSLTNSGNSTGNSTSTLTNSGNSSAAASNNGNGSNNASYNSSTTVNEARIPVATAFASAQSTAGCFKAYGAGAQTVPFGLSLAGGKVDENCARLETARSLALSGNRLAYCKVMLTDKYVKQANVTLEDCLTVPVVGTPVPVPVTPLAPVVPNIIVNVPAPVVPVPPVATPTVSVVQLKELGSCKINPGITNVCKRIADSAILALQTNPNVSLALTGPQEGAKVVVYLRSRGIDPNRIRMNFSDEQNWNLNFAIWSTN